jgi:triosephosphate isomerase
MNTDNSRPFIAGNWKMHNTIKESIDLVKAICDAGTDIEKSEVVVIPPFTALYAVQELLHECSVRLGAQNLFWEEKGAFTGEISPAMLRDSGCSYVTVGHSERRQFFGETNDSVNKKIKAALSNGLTPIMCIGETIEEREQEKTIQKIETQIEEGLEGISTEQMKNMVFAYEPIWAIGTGLTATPEQAQEVHSFIRDKLKEKHGIDTSSCAIILYGGSVKPASTFSLLKEKDINGALVGGASLAAEPFIEIIKEAVKAY